MQPGMPQGFGVVGEDTPIFTLPGNPVIAYVSFMVFVRPAANVRRPSPERPASGKAVTTGPLRSPRDRVLPARPCSTRRRTVAPVGGQGSHQLASLAPANALIVVPEAVTSCPRAPTWRCSYCLTGTRGIRRSPTSTRPGGAHGGRLGQGRHRPHRDRHRPGAALGRGRGALRDGTSPRATRSPSRGSPGSRAPSGPPT